MTVRRLALAVLTLFLVAAFALWRLEDHDLMQRRSAPFSFTAGDNRLSGTLWLPDGDPIAAIVLVHGDGPQDRTSSGGYAPLVNVLLDGGIAVASWDKPGVGASSGNWLDQTMADRAHEVRAALKALAGALGEVSRGAIGFSQAGWVLPKLSAEDADFLLLIGPAISWKEQGRFYTRRRLELAGESEATIAQVLARIAEQDERLFGANARFDAAAVPDGMDHDRWEFIRRNRMADATSDLSMLDVPTLALWGKNDLNVDATTDSAIYRTILSRHDTANRIIVIPDATHSLLKAGPYNFQLVSQWSLWAQARFILEGRFAYAPGALDAITGFIEQAANAGHGHEAELRERFALTSRGKRTEFRGGANLGDSAYVSCTYRDGEDYRALVRPFFTQWRKSRPFFWLDAHLHACDIASAVRRAPRISMPLPPQLDEFIPLWLYDNQ